jgi:hypothetical protein
MAFLARRVLMFPLQEVLGFGVVKGFGVKRDELKLSAFMLRVTALALFGVALAVESSFLLSVDADFLVAHYALGRERLLERGVAFKTALLDLGMGFRDLARHHASKQAEPVGNGGPNREQQQEER